MIWFFGHKACGILAPWPGIEAAPPASEGKVLTIGPPGKFRKQKILNKWKPEQVCVCVNI